jgi:septal ring factor EnvC (AmiA/AmiB activator)
VRQKFYSFLLVLLLFLAQSVLGQSNFSLEKINAKIANLQHQLLKKQESKSSLAVDLAALEGKINQGNNQLRQLDKETRAQNALLEPLIAQQTQLENQVTQERNLLAKQLQASYELGEHGFLEILLSGQDPEQLSRMLIYYQSINAARAELIANYLKSLAAVKANRRILNDSLAKLNQLRASQMQQQTNLKSQTQSRSQLLQQINQQIKTNKQRIARLEIDKKKLEQVVSHLNINKNYAGLSGISFEKLKGRLPWPTMGKITRSYGQIYDERLISNGVFIAAPEGTSVRAVASGQVIFADYLRGYGNLLILSHKGGYMTLYAHNNALFKKVGENVEPGDELGLTGNSGGLADTGLYFEIRYQGKARDPAKWCKGKP